jgi:hypothetical protein
MLLEDTHGIRSTQNSNRSSEPDIFCLGSCRRKNKRWCGVEKTFSVVLSNAKIIDPHLVSKGNPIQLLFHGNCITDGILFIATHHGGKTVNPYFHNLFWANNWPFCIRHKGRINGV